MSATYRTEVEGIFDITSLGVVLEETASSTYSFTSTSTEFISEISGLQAGFVDLFAALFAPTVALVLLAMGALISLKAVPEGAKGIMSFTTYKGIPRARALVARGARSIRGEVTDIRQKIQAGRALGLSGSRATGLALKRYAQRRLTPSSAAITVKGKTVFPAGRKAQITRAIGVPLIVVPAKIGNAVRKGILSAAKTASMAQVKKGMKVKKTREQKPCPYCDEDIQTDAKFCPECGESLS